MKRHQSISPMLRNGDLSFWTQPVNFEVEYLLNVKHSKKQRKKKRQNTLNEETEGLLTDTEWYISLTST